MVHRVNERALSTGREHTRGEPAAGGAGRCHARPMPARTCNMCGGSFPSRNELFRHLRDASSPCGAAVAEKGGIAFGEARPSKKDALKARIASMGAEPASSSQKSSKEKRTINEAKSGLGGKSGPKLKQRKRKASDRIARRFATSHEQELWMGDIPSEYATKKALGKKFWRSREGGFAHRQASD